MKKISLLRHAKSDWDAPYGGDHERPLNKRGKNAARLMGEELNRLNFNPDYILCSTAVRTKETLSIIAECAGWTSPIHFRTALYLCSTEDVRKEIVQLPDSSESVLIVGHQPTTGAFAHWLSDQVHVEVPTCTFLSFNVEIDLWPEISTNCAGLEVYLTPKSIS